MYDESYDSKCIEEGDCRVGQVVERICEPNDVLIRHVCRQTDSTSAAEWYPSQECGMLCIFFFYLFTVKKASKFCSRKNFCNFIGHNFME